MASSATSLWPRPLLSRVIRRPSPERHEDTAVASLKSCNERYISALAGRLAVACGDEAETFEGEHLVDGVEGVGDGCEHLRQTAGGDDPRAG